ncbi:MAG: hypothetical protein K6D02_09875 [Lachnospiraceae bacterium]|nr:hypothetical protein [Lachnospiraceae bacterium]
MSSYTGTNIFGCITKDFSEEDITKLKDTINSADAVIIGAGAGLSTSAGFVYAGERFDKYFFDFADKFGIEDMYLGSFYPFSKDENRWAFMARLIYYNRYIDAPKPVYKELLELVHDKDYFVITTNVDHQFQRAGFDKSRLFYTQGDYGLFQSVNPKINKTYDNEDWVMKAMEAQGFVKDENGVFTVPEDRNLKTEIPTDLIPTCPDNGDAVTMNLRADDSFVEDLGWKRAAKAYSDYINQHENKKVLYLELGVGNNTPIIIKYQFWRMVAGNENATYACVNFGQAYCPSIIEDRSILIDADIAEVLEKLR